MQMENSKHFRNPAGYIPDCGVITVDELQQRLKLRESRTLVKALREHGIPIGILSGKKVIRCDSLDRLFWTDDEAD